MRAGTLGRCGVSGYGTPCLRALGLFLSLCMFLLAEPFATQIAAQPHALFSLLAIAPAALFGCLTAVERGYWEACRT